MKIGWTYEQMEAGIKLPATARPSDAFALEVEAEDGTWYVDVEVDGVPGVLQFPEKHFPLGTCTELVQLMWDVAYGYRRHPAVEDVPAGAGYDAICDLVVSLPEGLQITKAVLGIRTESLGNACQMSWNRDERGYRTPDYKTTYTWAITLSTGEVITKTDVPTGPLFSNDWTTAVCHVYREINE